PSAYTSGQPGFKRPATPFLRRSWRILCAFSWHLLRQTGCKQPPFALCANWGCIFLLSLHGPLQRFVKQTRLLGQKQQGFPVSGIQLQQALSEGKGRNFCTSGAPHSHHMAYPAVSLFPEHFKEAFQLFLGIDRIRQGKAV